MVVCSHHLSCGWSAAPSLREWRVALSALPNPTARNAVQRLPRHARQQALAALQVVPHAHQAHLATYLRAHWRPPLAQLARMAEIAHNSQVMEIFLPEALRRCKIACCTRTRTRLAPERRAHAHTSCSSSSAPALGAKPMRATCTLRTCKRCKHAASREKCTWGVGST